jgi:hypothetical protein
MEQEDLLDVAVRQFTEGQTKNNKDDGKQPEEQVVEKVEPIVETVEQPIIKTDEPIDIPTEKLLAKFNELSGANFDTIDKIKDFADKYNKYPDLEKQLEVMPELLEIMGKFENPVNFFKDETAFKVNELSKDVKYVGKETLIDKILRGNLLKEEDVEVIRIATNLKAKDGVRNPLRAELKSMGLDPDEVLDNYDSLDEDSKDQLKIKADQYREELPKIGENVKVPTLEGTTLERILNQQKTAKEDLSVRREKLMPLSESIVTQIKDLKVTDDFSFKLDLTPQQVKEYAAELADVVVSGQYDLNTEEGKQQVYGAMVDMFKIDYFDKIVTALANAKTSQTEEEARRRFNNEKPLDKKEPNPIKDETEKHPMQRAAEEMISRGY